MDSDTKTTTSDTQEPVKVRRTRKAATEKSAKTKTRVTKTTRSKASEKKEAAVAVAPAEPEVTKAQKNSVRTKKAEEAAPIVESEQPKPRRGRKPKQKPIEETVSAVAVPTSQDKQTAQEASAAKPADAVTVREEKPHRAKKSNNNRSEKKKEEASSVFAQPETVGGGEDEHTGGRRKRRRRNRRNGQNEGNAPQPGNNLPVNIKKLHRRAWQIFLGEVTEEGLALMDDATARETARRAYRVAEFFLIEAARHDKKARPNEAQTESTEAQPNAEA